jgi:hypothetical protein
MAEWRKAKVLITARTYPTPSYKGIEVSCTAGISESGDWLRLFPIPYRFLTQDQRFRKYQWIEARITKASDARPESYNIDIDSIQIVSEPLSTVNAWHARRELLAPLISPSLCHLMAQRDAHKFPTLGLFKPGEISKLVLEPDSPEWSSTELAKLRQINLFAKAPKKELEKIPYKFKYRFKCADPACENGHELMCADWELGQSYRSWLDKYGDDWEAKFRERYEYDMITKLDTHFHVGTVSSHPNRWIIVSLFYPPPEPPIHQLKLL